MKALVLARRPKDEHSAFPRRTGTVAASRMSHVLA